MDSATAPTSSRSRRPQIPSWEATISGAPLVEDPAFGPNFTFADILTLRLPTVRDVSRSEHTAPYSDLYPSPTPPRFYLRDDDLLSSLVETFYLLVSRQCKAHHRPLSNCNTPPKARAAWEFLKEHVETPYTNEGFIATYAVHINNILSALCYYINETTCVTSASIQEFSQCGDQIITRAFRQDIPGMPTVNWPVSGIAVEWKTSRVFECHRHELSEFSVICDGTAEGMEGIMKKLGLHMNTVESHMRSEINRLEAAAQRNYPGPSDLLPANRFGAIFTGVDLVMVEAITGVFPDGTSLPGLAYTTTAVESRSAGDGSSHSILALMIAALYDVGRRSTIDDLSDPAQNIWNQYNWQLGSSPGGEPGTTGSKSLPSSQASGASGGGSPQPHNFSQMHLKYDLDGFNTAPRPLLCCQCVPNQASFVDAHAVLELNSNGARVGSRASTFRGVLHMGDTDLHVFLKTYPRVITGFLDRERAAYTVS
ncbi:hypothetical protein R3P38DRAFT_3290701, partial [Favolaschia claudopus]